MPRQRRLDPTRPWTEFTTTKADWKDADPALLTGMLGQLQLIRAFEETVLPHSSMRRAIARRLTESKSTVPHFYLAADCRVDDLLELRRAVNEQAQAKITLNDFVVKPWPARLPPSGLAHSKSASSTRSASSHDHGGPGPGPIPPSRPPD